MLFSLPALFIILNRIFQSELGFIPLRNDNLSIPNYKNTSYIWGPLNSDGSVDPIGGFLAIFTPDFFKTIPVGPNQGQLKYWPWFWLLCPIYLIVTTVAFLLSLIWDHKTFLNDVRNLPRNVQGTFGKLWTYFAKKEKRTEKTREALRTELL